MLEGVLERVEVWKLLAFSQLKARERDANFRSQKFTSFELITYVEGRKQNKGALTFSGSGDCTGRFSASMYF